eukprot:sb/3469910/
MTPKWFLYQLVSIPKCRFRILTLLCLFAKQKGIRVDAFGIHPGREKIIFLFRKISCMTMSQTADFPEQPHVIICNDPVRFWHTRSLHCLLEPPPKEGGVSQHISTRGSRRDISPLLVTETTGFYVTNGPSFLQFCSKSSCSSRQLISLQIMWRPRRTSNFSVEVPVGLSNIQFHIILQSDPYLVPPDLVAPRFSDTINFPRYRKLTLFDPDLVPTPI